MNADDLVFVGAIFFVSACLVTILIAHLRWKGIEKSVHESNDKVVPVNPQFGDFSGLGDEPVWKGNLPKMVNDYVKPRYVYENCVEKETYDKSCGRVIGYRISPTLVIHSMIAGNSCCDVKDAIAFKNKYCGSFLDKNDVKVLRKKWDIVSKMRTDIGDTPLPKIWFWAEVDGVLEVHHYKKDVIDEFYRANVILKR